MPPDTSTQHKAVSPEAWLAARRALLAKERQLTHRRDELRAEGSESCCHAEEGDA